MGIPASTQPDGQRPAEGLDCPGCGIHLTAIVPDLDGKPVGVLSADPLGDWIAVRVDGGWRVRKLSWPDRLSGDLLDPRLRRRVHRCDYRYRCLGDAGQCPRPARKYPNGTWCGACRVGGGGTGPIANDRAVG